jgi:hypothetical protein
LDRVTRFFLLLALVLQAAPAAAEERFSLYCARGTPDYPDADLVLSAAGHHVVRVVFVGFRPSPARADWSLRDCLDTAARYAGSRDIVASLWYRERDADQAQPLAPYSAAYQASSRTVVSQRHR